MSRSTASLPPGGKRREHDSMGEIEVPASHYWGAQTQRSLEHFAIAGDRMPVEVIRAYGLVKKAAAEVNTAAGRLEPGLAAAIVEAAGEVSAGQLDAEFPLSVWQTGSGTQTNMNANEVIANRASLLLAGRLDGERPVHPNDHVNMSQSSNDTFPTVMHVASVLAIDRQLLPEVEALTGAIEQKARLWKDVVKVGRTHLQDAVPLTVGQEWSGYAAQLRMAAAGIRESREALFELAAGGTAVGTGLNSPPGFDRQIASRLEALTGLPFRPAENKFAALAGLEAMVHAHAALRGLAVVLIKIANDMRWLASGPRCGLGELRLPENEPGSSIMPGKVNPTQSEALVMLSTQVLGNDAAVAFAGAQGTLELNTMRPVVIYNYLHSLHLLADGCSSFRRHQVEGTELNRDRIAELLGRSLMLVTALSPVIGYEKAAAIAHLASERGLTLREAALESGWIDARRFDEVVDPARMV